MKHRPDVPVLILLAAGLFVSAAVAQFPFWPDRRQGFATPTAAAEALNEASSLPVRTDLLPSVAAAYLEAHAYEDLPSTMAILPVPEDATWQRTFLLAKVYVLLGNAKDASRLIGQLPEASLRDPVVLKFRIEHPELFGDNALQSPPNVDSGTPVEAATDYLNTLEPEKAWEVIAAHPDKFLADLGTLHALTAQIADQNLASRLLPLLEERARSQSENWELRLTLAMLQLLSGDTASATETFRQVYHWTKDDSSPPPTPAERVAAMQGMGPFDLRYVNSIWVFAHVKTLANARDFALICLAKLADERGDGAAFIHRLQEEYRNDEIGRVTALMLINSPRLVLQELQAALAKGLPPGLGTLATPWLRSPHPNSTGSDSSLQERYQLAAAFARLNPPVPPGAAGSAAIPSKNNPTWPKELVEMMEVSKSVDPAVKERFFAHLTASTDSRIDIILLLYLFQQTAKQPDDAFFAQGAAILLAKAAADVDGSIALRALYRTSGGYQPPTPPFNGMGSNPLFGAPGARWPSPPARLLSVDEQIEAMFLAQSQPAWLRFAAQAAARPGEEPAHIPVTLAPVLEKLANDASSPLHLSARWAEAYLLHDVAGQEDHALDLLRQAITESPSYTARFWLTAFLARRQQYKEATEVFDGIQPIPGYFEAFLQEDRTSLQRAAKGGPLSEHEPHLATPLPPVKRPATVAALVADLQRIIDAKSTDPASAQQALAMATKLAAIFPAEAFFAGRKTVLKAFATFGGLDEETARIEERAKQFPLSADAQLALGEAWTLSPRPEAPAASVAAYREAFRLAPDRADVAEKMLDSRFSIQEREDADYVLLRHGVSTPSAEQANLVGIFKEPDALARYIRAYGEGFKSGNRHSYLDSFQLKNEVAAWRKAGQDDAVIDLLTAINDCVPMGINNDDEPEKLLIGLLEEKGRAAEAALVVDRILFPSEYLYGLDLEDNLPMPVLSPDVREFIQKVGTPGQMAIFRDHARHIMADRPGDTRASLVLLTLLIMDHAPALHAELTARLEALGTGPDEQLASDLSTLAQMASTAPETKFAALDLLAEARRRQKGTLAELATIELLAATALDLGDRARAEEALKEILVAAKTQQTSFDVPNWLADLKLMAQCGMAPEAAEFCTLAYSRIGDPFAQARGPKSPYVLAYIEACIQYGQPEMARQALADFQHLLETDMADVHDPDQSVYQYRFDQNFLDRMVEVSVLLDRADAAAQGLRTLLTSRLAAAKPELRTTIEAAQELLAQATGGPGAMPVAFLESEQASDLTLWWNVAARTTRSSSWARGDVSVFGADPKSLDGRYSVEILGGDTQNHLTRLAVIPNAPGRGEWHGSPETKPAAIRFTRVILTDAGGATVIGPSVPMWPGEERLGDPEMYQVIKAGISTASWTLPEGVLSTEPGPIPGHPAIAFVNRSVRNECEIRGARIPVHPGESFVQSAWLRSGEGCRWGARCFDAQGKELTAGYGLALSTSYGSPGWTLVEQRLDNTGPLPKGARRGVAELLPAGTAFIEPVLKLNFPGLTWDARTSVRWAGLSLRSVPPSENLPQPPNGTPEQLDQGEIPAPAVAADKLSAARNEAIFAGFSSPAWEVAASPESDMIVVGCKDGTLHFLAYPSGKELASVHAHNDPVVDLAVLPGNAGVYSVDKRGDTHFVAIKPEKDDLVACTAHYPSAAVISPARKWVIFASDETLDEPAQDKIRIEVVDLTTGKQIRLFEQPGLFNQLSLSSDEKELSVRRAAGSSYVVSSWELPTFNKLPDRNEDRGLPSMWRYAQTEPLFVADPPRNRYVMVEGTGRFVVRNMDNEILWTFSPASEATSLAVVPKDGAILVGKADGKVWRCVSPK